jgi:hypothetical protein
MVSRESRPKSHYIGAIPPSLQGFYEYTMGKYGTKQGARPLVRDSRPTRGVYAPTSRIHDPTGRAYAPTGRAYAPTGRAYASTGPPTETRSWA